MKTKEARIEEVERKLNGDGGDVLVIYWEGDDFVTFCLPLSMRGKRMNYEEYRQKYYDGTEVVVRYTEDWNEVRY